MPVTFPFELEGVVHEVELIGSLIERFGSERLDSRTYRYPRFGRKRGDAPEDWFNHVVPALMLFRSFVLSRGVRSYTLDVDASTGNRRDAGIGSPPLPSNNIQLYEPIMPPRLKVGSGGEERSSEEWAVLNEWLDSLNFPLGL